MEQLYGDFDCIVETLNSLREGVALQSIDLDAHVNYTTSTLVSISFRSESEASEERVKEEAKIALESFISNNAAYKSGPSETQQDVAALLSPWSTHVSVNVKRSASAVVEEIQIANNGDLAGDEEDKLVWCLSVSLTYRYLELREVGPVIDGDLVIQGCVLKEGFIPALCVVDFAHDHEENLDAGICIVAPWDMMLIDKNDDDNEEGEKYPQFTIPIHLEDGHREGSVRVSIYIGKQEDVIHLYSGKDESFLEESNVLSITNSARVNSLGQKYVLASSLMTPSRKIHEISEPYEAPLRMRNGSIVDIKLISSEGEEAEHLKGLGYNECSMINVTDSNRIEQQSVGKVHVLYQRGHGDEVKPISDVEFITIPKNRPENVDGVEHEAISPPQNQSNDVSRHDNTDEFRLQLHFSEGEGFDSLVLLVSDTTVIDNGGDKDALNAYLIGLNYCHRFVPIPLGSQLQYEISENGIYGFLLYNSGDLENDVHSVASENRSIEILSSTSPETNVIPALIEPHAISLEGGNVLAEDVTSGADAIKIDSEDDEDDEVDEELVAEQLEKKVSDLMSQEASITIASANLQRQCVTIIAREKASNNANLSTTKRATSETMSAGGTVENANNNDGSSSGSDRNAEKESSLNSILTSITSSRIKIAQQMADYDQLSHDLQTRLDDREFKATEITESFAAFKREILAKAENTRTNRPLSNRLIKQFARAQSARDEDLERVRLRNISMRRQLARLEKQLRAREQLAEGLHMIDFEQLKVENQTLYEKIEERTEELTKLKRKKNNTVQVLTHVREKLRCIENNNMALNNHLSGVENETMSKRGVLTGSKKDRDFIREDNKELRRKQGFSSSTGLLTDFEERVKGLGDIKAKINELSDKYNMLAVQVQRDTALITSVVGLGTQDAQFPSSSDKGAVTVDQARDDRDLATGSKTPFFPGAIPDTR